MRPGIICLLLILQAAFAYAKLRPAEDDTLNYRLVTFSDSSIHSAEKFVGYRLEVAKGNYTNESLFTKNIFLVANDSINRFVKLLSAFGQVYTWRITGYTRKKVVYKAPLQHFSTGYNPYVDTSRYRLKILSNNLEAGGMYIFLDNTRTLCDMDGNMIWYLPNIPGVLDSNTVVRDMHATKQGTICFVTTKNVYEVDYDANVLWQAPNDGKVSRDTSEFYHHEFTRLSNGNYLVAGNEYIEREIPGDIDTTIYNKQPGIIARDGKHYTRIQCGTLIEYDAAQNIRWIWRASDHFDVAEYFTRRSPRGMFNTSTHLNGFYFDEDKQVIYTSFRDLNRVIKINYPAGNIIAEYGMALPDYGSDNGKSLFLSQHNINKGVNGELLLFNNNIRSKDRSYTHSTVMALEEPQNTSGGLRKAWEFRCDVDTLAEPYTLSGGSITPFSGQSYLVSMGSTNRLFIVARDNKLLWNALCQRKDIYTEGMPWAPQSGYKVSSIGYAALLRILINSKGL